MPTSTRSRTTSASPPAKAAPRAAARSAEQQLARFVAKFSPSHQTRIHAVLRAMRKRLPSAHELVWDNYNFFVIGYSPTERPSDALLSIAAHANGINLFFLHGARLKDRHKLLQGGGKQVRFVRLDSAATSARPEVEAFLAAAIAGSAKPFPGGGRGKLIIRAISPQQRPRRKAPARGTLGAHKRRG